MDVDYHQCDPHWASLTGRADCRLHGMWEIKYGDGSYRQVEFIHDWIPITSSARSTLRTDIEAIYRMNANYSQEDVSVYQGANQVTNL